LHLSAPQQCLKDNFQPSLGQWMVRNEDLAVKFRCAISQSVFNSAVQGAHTLVSGMHKVTVLGLKTPSITLLSIIFFSFNSAGILITSADHWLHEQTTDTTSRPLIPRADHWYHVQVTKCACRSLKARADQNCSSKTPSFTLLPCVKYLQKNHGARDRNEERFCSLYIDQNPLMKTFVYWWEHHGIRDEANRSLRIDKGQKVTHLLLVFFLNCLTSAVYSLQKCSHHRSSNI